MIFQDAILCKPSISSFENSKILLMDIGQIVPIIRPTKHNTIFVLQIINFAGEIVSCRCDSYIIRSIFTHDSYMSIKVHEFRGYDRDVVQVYVI